MKDRWASGDAYEPFIGRWSRLVAPRFVRWLDESPRRRWLDVGCGTGALTQIILSEVDPEHVLGVDPSSAFVEHAASNVRDPRAEFRVGEAAATGARDESFDFVVSGLVMNFVPDPGVALVEMSRVTVPGGRVAAYVWDYAEGMEMLRHFWDAARELDPTAAELDEGERFTLCRASAIERLWRDGGLDDVEVESIEVPTVFHDFDDYWGPFLGGQGPAPTYMATLADDDRGELKALLRERLRTVDDGSISLTARAWAVQGRVG